MRSRPHLPEAIEYADRGSLQDVRDTVLVRLLDECAEWMVETEAFRTALVSPSAMVLWRVLNSGETELVEEAVCRIVAEMGDRLLSARTDAVPAPGEVSKQPGGFNSEAATIWFILND